MVTDGKIAYDLRALSCIRSARTQQKQAVIFFPHTPPTASKLFHFILKSECCVLLSVGYPRDYETCDPKIVQTISQAYCISHS